MNKLDAPRKIKRWIVILILTLMAVDLIIVIVDGQWLSAFLILAIATLILVVTTFRNRLAVQIPIEFQIVALIFIFTALFLGEGRSYYDKVWWWDVALHSTSGLLMGILGFLLVYVLNSSEKIVFSMTPAFSAVFAFMFAVGTGAVWEVFEFTMDSLFGTTMQTAMFGDPTGLTDTMWDIIVNTIGAAIISTLGWWYMRHDRRSFIDRLIHRFIDRNPRLFQS